LSVAAKILDGKRTAAHLRDELAGRVAQLRARGVAPKLVVVLVGEDPASQVYVRNKSRSAGKIGIDAETRELPATIEQRGLEKIVVDLGRDPSVHGILVQLPLPDGLDAERVIRCIPPGKDVDGLHPVNVGELARGTPHFAPCTPAGVIVLLHRYEIPIAGRHVVIVGRSNLVGRPLASLLLLKGPRGDASVTVCHSRSQGLADIVRAGDIVVAAVGRPNTITADMVRPGAAVVDVGMNRIDDPSTSSGSRLVGDVDYEPVSEVAEWITPVPGGVGPMTVALLLANTVQAAEEHASIGNAVSA
jgi:methylenetetrahydrofolate dehydrogenase (NADP+)/methenyltetrahydrofolate cyclohydrolase